MTGPFLDGFDKNRTHYYFVENRSANAYELFLHTPREMSMITLTIWLTWGLGAPINSYFGIFSAKPVEGAFNSERKW